MQPKLALFFQALHPCIDHEMFQKDSFPVALGLLSLVWLVHLFHYHLDRVLMELDNRLLRLQYY
jgi:hypothetical protein